MREQMAVAKVYHQCDVSESKRADEGDASFPQWPQGYVMVGLLCLESEGIYAQLVEVIRRTRHGTRRWFHGAGLLATPRARRSTMIGDIIILNDRIAYRLRGDRLERLQQVSAQAIPPASVYAEAS